MTRRRWWSRHEEVCRRKLGQHVAKSHRGEGGWQWPHRRSRKWFRQWSMAWAGLAFPGKKSIHIRWIWESEVYNVDSTFISGDITKSWHCSGSYLICSVDEEGPHNQYGNEDDQKHYPNGNQGWRKCLSKHCMDCGWYADNFHFGDTSFIHNGFNLHIPPPWTSSTVNTVVSTRSNMKS